MPLVYFGIGSNVDAEANLRLAIDALRQRYGTIRVSPVYRNRSVGFDGDDFLNLAVAIETDDSLDRVIRAVEDIHLAAGRVRSADRYSSRNLDIDILMYGRRVSHGPPLELPRPDILQYSFVLKPLADIAPRDTHPQTGASFERHWKIMERLGSHPLEPTGLAFD